jgi:hypothetical protein
VTARELSGRAKCALLRRGHLVSIIFKFADIHDAMAVFDMWSMEEVDLHFKGPKVVVEEDDEPMSEDSL